jgi:hypothetical protein
MDANDAVNLATITSAITLLGTKVAEEAVSDVSKTVWARVKGLFGWTAEPPHAELALRTAQHLQEHPEQMPQVLQLLREDPGAAGMLVGHITAEKVIVAQRIDTVNM